MAGVGGGNAKRAGWYGAGLLVSLAWVGVGLAPLADAQEVQAIICRNPAQVTLHTPQNDSVIQESGVRLEGTVQQATQLEVYVDAQLDKIIPIGVTDTTFATTVQLMEGTHTLRVVAVDVCQIGNGEASAVVTYQPLVAQESEGAKVPTTISGVRVGGAPIDTPTTPVWPPASVKDAIAGVIDFFDIVPPSRAIAEVPQPVRFGLLTSGALLAIFSQALSMSGVTGRFAQAASIRLGLRSAFGPRLLLLGVGGILVVLAFVL